MNFQVGYFGLLALLVCGNAQSLNFTSSLQSRNRNYTCSGDVATFLCSGIGGELIFYAPPFVDLALPIRYLRGETLGAGAFRTPLIASLISTTDPEMVGELTIRADAPVQELTVRCIVRSPSPSEEGVALYRREGVLQDASSPNVTQLFNDDDVPNDFESGTVEVSWTGTSGNFDISHYTIELFVNGIKDSSINVSPDVVSARFSALIGSPVHARIIVNSACGSSTAGVRTDSIKVSRSTSINVAIVFFVLLPIAVLALGIAVGVVSVLLCLNKAHP